jgi:hypothetical protein
MALIKKIDVDKYFAAKRAMRSGRLGMVSQHGVAEIKPAAKKQSVPASVKALPLETPSPGISSASIPIVFDSGRNRLLRPPASRPE